MEEEIDLCRPHHINSRTDRCLGCGKTSDEISGNKLETINKQEVEQEFRGIMYKNARSMPSRIMNKKIREAAARLGITIEK